MRDDKNNMGMYSTSAAFAGIVLEVDPISRTRCDEDDNAMAIFFEEQPFMWYTLRDKIGHTISNTVGNVDFLDVGTGSGVWGILIAKHFSKNVIALDISKRAVNFARNNAMKNHVSFDIRNEEYSNSTIGQRQAKVIGLFPPYHLYPKEVEETIPLHARGGVDGQDEFKNQLSIARQHVAENGIIIFNMMCLGANRSPEYLTYIPELITNKPSIYYTNVFPPMSSDGFLEEVYGNNFQSFQDSITVLYPELFYTIGYIQNDGLGKVQEFRSNVNLIGRTWRDRIELHKQIANHATSLGGRRGE
jgi:16S rRNA G966 N2-methylase RsmD